MVTVPIRLVGYDRLRSTVGLSLFSVRPEGMAKLAKQCGVLALREEADYFASNRGPDGVAWKPLSQTTIARRRKGRGKNRSAQILRDTGRLRISVTPGSGGFESSAPGAVRLATSAGFVIGTNLNYAASHQYGRGAISGVRQSVRPHIRRSHVRKDGVRVKRHMVSAFSRIVSLKAIPRRIFVGWSDRLIIRCQNLVGRHLFPESS